VSPVSAPGSDRPPPGSLEPSGHSSEAGVPPSACEHEHEHDEAGEAVRPVVAPSDDRVIAAFQSLERIIEWSVPKGKTSNAIALIIAVGGSIAMIAAAASGTLGTLGHQATRELPGGGIAHLIALGSAAALTGIAWLVRALRRRPPPEPPDPAIGAPPAGGALEAPPARALVIPAHPTADFPHADQNAGTGPACDVEVPPPQPRSSAGRRNQRPRSARNRHSGGAGGSR